MRALVYQGTKTLEFGDMPDPSPAAGEHLVRIAAAGICGSDMHAYLGHDARRPPPLILGHEAAGTIVGGPKDGARVTINPLVTFGESPACRSGRENICPDREIISMPPRQGAFAEYVAMPARNLVEVPDAFPLSKAAMAEPLAVSWHAARLALEALHPGSERRALVIGGGAIGVASALALGAMGVPEITIVERSEARRGYLREVCGQTAVAEAAGLHPIVIDAVGLAATRRAASALTEPGGVIVHIGLGEDSGGLDIRRLTLQEITFIGSYTYTAKDFRDTAEAMFAGRLGSLDWAEIRALSDGAQAFSDLHAGAVATPKVILDPSL